MSLLWGFLPDEFMPLAIAGVGFAVILGFLRLRKAATMWVDPVSETVESAHL